MHDTDIFQLIQVTDYCLFFMAHTDKTTDDLTFVYFKNKLQYFYLAIWLHVIGSIRQLWFE